MKQKTILIVEDDGVLAVQLQNMLIELGYNVLEMVVAGEEAIAAVAADRPDLILPDLILMDIQLAGEMDGITAAERICSVADINERNPGVCAGTGARPIAHTSTGRTCPDHRPQRRASAPSDQRHS